MRPHLFIFLSLFLGKLSCVCADEFWIINVGQGNCQLAIYEEEKIGILYDCGSSSQKISSKILNFTTEKYQLFIQKEEDVEGFDDDKASTAFLSEKMEEDSDSSFSQSQHSKPKDASKIELFNFKDKLKTLKHLFIILSHPDKDHINLINANTIPDNIPITVLCEGDWFRQKHTKEDCLSVEVCNVLQFLKKRDKINIVFPFYSNGLRSISKTIPWPEIWEQFLSDDKNFSETFKLCRQGSIKPSLCLESLDNVLGDGVDLGVDKKILKNIKIAHINFPFNDVNSQSAIVEIKMEKLKMQFFLTGDASNETLSYIVDKNFFRKQEDYTSLLMLPHHGSIENNSVYILDIFQPDIIGISAGNGGQFAHPSKELVDEIQDAYAYENLKFVFVGEKNNFIYFDSASHAHLYTQDDKKGKMPFICTNILGNICINETGFLSCFSSSVQCGERVFQVNYKKSIIPINPQKLESTNIFKAKLKNNEKEEDIYCYFLKDKYYLAEEVGNEG